LRRQAGAKQVKVKVHAEKLVVPPLVRPRRQVEVKVEVENERPWSGRPSSGKPQVALVGRGRAVSPGIPDDQHSIEIDWTS
jgi:hypothetical protein